VPDRRNFKVSDSVVQKVCHQTEKLSISVVGLAFTQKDTLSSNQLLKAISTHYFVLCYQIYYYYYVLIPQAVQIHRVKN